MADSKTQEQATPRIRRKIVLFEDPNESVIRRIELKEYFGRILNKDVRGRILECSSGECKLSVHYRNGKDVECKVYHGYEIVRKELIRLMRLVEGKS